MHNTAPGHDEKRGAGLARGALLRSITLVLLLAGVAGLQFRYGAVQARAPQGRFSLSPKFVRSFDLGLHSALASFRWIETRTEIPSLQVGYDTFRNNFDLIVNLDPRWNTPYLYTELVLPLARRSIHPNAVTSTIEIGEAGIRSADPDWRLSFYLAALYHLERKDYQNAAVYFDRAAETWGIPDHVRRFARNYGIAPSARERTKQIWAAIYESTENVAVRLRARAYIIHFTLLDTLDTGVQEYERRFGKRPERLEDLVAENITAEIPRSPFGYEFYLYPEGVGIKPANETRN